MCTTCGNNNCGCSGINLTSIKGDPGADSTVPGPAGNGIMSVVAHPTLANTWVITYTNGTTANVATPIVTNSGSTTYFAWADDNLGSGYTVIPANRLYLGITNVVATSGSPIASDFTGKWFLINQPKLRYETARYLGLSQVLNPAGTGGQKLFIPALPSLTVAPEYFASVNSYIEYDANFVFSPFSTSFGGSVFLDIDINGSLIRVGETNFGLALSSCNLKVKMYYESSTSIRVYTVLHKDFSTSGENCQISEHVVTIIAASPITIYLKEYYQDVAEGTFRLISHGISAFNPNKTTIT